MTSREKHRTLYWPKKQKSKKRQVKGNNISLHRLKSVSLAVQTKGKEEGNERDRQQVVKGKDTQRKRHSKEKTGNKRQVRTR